jgi:hypothetical protein
MKNRRGEFRRRNWGSIGGVGFIEETEGRLIRSRLHAFDECLGRGKHKGGVIIKLS